MKKIVKVKISVSEEPKGTFHYSYPTGYDPKKINVLSYGDTESGVKYCVGVVEESDLGSFLELDDVLEISKIEANVFGKEYQTIRTRVVDEEAFAKSIKKAIPDVEGIETTPEFDVKKHL